MSDQDWLSLSAIARYWSEETGQDAEAIERDLEAWFSDFVERARTHQSEPSGAEADTTNRLMGLLGGQYLQRETLAIYCEETGRDLPRFWAAAGGRNTPPQPPFATAPSVAAEGDGGSAETPQIDDGAATLEPAASRTEPAEPAADPGDEHPRDEDPGDEGPFVEGPFADPPSARELPARPANLNVSPAAIAWPPPSRSASPRRAVLLLAGGLAMALASLAGGYILGQGSTQAPSSAPSAATVDRAPPAEVGALPDDLDRARKKIAILAAALDRTEKEKAGLAAELHKRQRALDAAAARPDAAGTDAKVAALTADLAAARAKIASLREAATDRDGEAVKRRLIEAATAASAEAMSFKAELEDARQRIGALELEAQSAKAEADSLATELTASRRQSESAQEAANIDTNPSRQQLILAVEIAGTQAALAKRDLAEALERLARSESEGHAAAARAAGLAEELADTRRQQAQATNDAEVAAAAARQELFLKAQSASSHAARLDQEVAIAREQIADLDAQLGAARAEAAGLAERLAELSRDREATLQGAHSDFAAERRDLIAAAEAAEAASAARQRKLDTALARIAELEAGRHLQTAARSAPQQTLPQNAAPQNAAPQNAAPQNAAPQNAAPQNAAPQNAAGEAAAPPAETTQSSSLPLPGARKPGRPVALLGRPEEPTVLAQDASDQTGSAPSSLPSGNHGGAQLAVARTNRTAEAVSVDSLVAAPGRYDARRVIVTGALLRLLEHYRLQSQSGLRTLVVEVAGIAPAQREALEQAIAKAGLIGSVRARISGRVERLSANAYRLAADDLILLE